MTASQRIRRAALPTVLAAVIGAGGFAVGTSTHWAAIGAQVSTVSGAAGTAAGVAIVEITKGGPADRAGLRAGDVIAMLAGTETPDTTALAEVLASKEPGQVVSVTVTRDDADHTVRLTLGELPGG
jgi:S1-C subfamily serine protease